MTTQDDLVALDADERQTEEHDVDLQEQRRSSDDVDVRTTISIESGAIFDILANASRRPTGIASGKPMATRSYREQPAFELDEDAGDDELRVEEHAQELDRVPGLVTHGCWSSQKIMLSARVIGLNSICSLAGGTGTDPADVVDAARDVELAALDRQNEVLDLDAQVGDGLARVDRLVQHDVDRAAVQRDRRA